MNQPPKLSLLDATALLVTLVIGVGIFRTPSLVASQVSSEMMLIALWCAGGLVSLAGALCYAELGSNYPDSDGEYGYLNAAYGDYVARLFGWSRLAVIQTGSIAMIAFIFADYVVAASGLNINPAWYAALAIVTITSINLVGLGPGTKTMNFLALWKAAGILGLVLAAHVIAGQSQPPYMPIAQENTHLSLAMVFVMLAYGGWNEASYLSRDIRNPKRNIMHCLLISVPLITLVYLLVNLAYLKSLGLGAFGASASPAADVTRIMLGPESAQYFSGFIAICALGALNATTITGSRSTSAFIANTPRFANLLGLTWLGERTALLVQAGAAMLLVLIGANERDGFEAMVAYTAPAFWIFFMLTTFSLIVLRHKHPATPRIFSVPFYPFTPLLFCAMCAAMTYASLRHAGIGSILGLGVMLLGFPLITNPRRNHS